MQNKGLVNGKLTDISTTATNELGIVFAEETTEGGKIYKYVQNVSGGALASGNCVVYDVTDDSGYKVTTTTDADSGAGAGIAISAIADDGYGWIQVGGVNTDALIKGDTDPTTAGALIGTSTTAGKLGGGTGFGTSFAQDAVSTDVAGTIFLRGLI